MRRSIEKLLTKFLELQKNKWHLIYAVYHKDAKRIEFFIHFYRLRKTILKESRTCVKLITAVEKFLSINQLDELEKLLRPLVKLSYSLLEVLHKELMLLKISPFNLYKDKMILAKQSESFHKMFEEELKLSKKFEITIVRHGSTLKIFKGYSARKREFEKTKRLLKGSRNAFKRLLKATNVKEAAQANKELMQVLNLLQRTEIYEFIKDDVERIKKKSAYIMKNPSKHKFMYFITGVYLAAPFTFEATGAVLALRYMTKYTVKQSKKVKKKIHEKKQLKIMR